MNKPTQSEPKSLRGEVVDLSLNDRRLCILSMSRKGLAAQCKHWETSMNHPEASKAQQEIALSRALDFQSLVHDCDAWIKELNESS